MRGMTLETKVRSALTIVVLAAIGAVFAWKWQTNAPLFVTACSMAGFIGGIYRRRDRPQPAPSDIEAEWTRRAQSGAFLDTMQFFVPTVLLASVVVAWAHEMAPFVFLTGLTVLAGIDYGVRYWLIRLKEQ